MIILERFVFPIKISFNNDVLGKKLKLVLDKCRLLGTEFTHIYRRKF